MTTDGRVLRLKTPEAFLPLLDNFMPNGDPVRYKGAYGGRAGGKDDFFASLIVEEALDQPGYRCVCIREIQKTLEHSVMQYIVEMIDRLSVRQYFDVQQRLIRTPGNGLILFNGMQEYNAESIKSLQGFDRAFMTEAQELSDKSLTLLRPTIRKPRSQIWAAWNPKTKPVDVEGIKRGDAIDVFLRGPDVPPDAIVIEVNFDDNPFLSDTLKREERYDRKHRQPEDYNHIWRGHYQTRSESRVFKNWKVREFDTPTNATFRFGADFGFSIDPSVLVRTFIGRFDDEGHAVADDNGRTLFIDMEAYRVGCDVDHTPALFAGNDPRNVIEGERWKNPYGDPGIPGAMVWPITCDSARPETISFLVRRGFRAKAAKKGAGSVEEGIEFLKAYDIVIHPRCLHTVDEFTFYSFKVDPKTGLVLPVLEDKKNHVIDSCRYAVEDVRRAKGFFS